MRIGVVFPQTEIGSDRGAVRAATRSGRRRSGSRTCWRTTTCSARIRGAQAVGGPLRRRHHVSRAVRAVRLSRGRSRRSSWSPASSSFRSGRPRSSRSRRPRSTSSPAAGSGSASASVERRGVRSPREDFSTRGRRIGEQVELMRSLWTQRSVSPRRDVRARDGGGPRAAAGAAPDPGVVRRRIRAAYRRAGRLADGWFPQVRPGPPLDAARPSRTGRGRRPRSRDARHGEGRVNWTADGVGKLVDHANHWRDVARDPPLDQHDEQGLATVDDHLAALDAAAETIPG